MTLTNDEFKRYGRQIVIPGFGIEGQEKLKNSKVLVVGAGGLGCPTSLYLAAAGVGKITLMDDDVVEISNLHRQILHHSEDLDKKKVLSAKEKLSTANPCISIETLETRLDSSNAMDIISKHDLVIDGTDSIHSKFLINDACVLSNKKCIIGGVSRYEGQILVVDPKNGPCYRCIFGNPPAEDMSRICAIEGVLGVAPGMIGLLQATEAIKIITGIGTSLVGRFLNINLLNMIFQEIKIVWDEKCMVCGDSPSITKLIDYQPSCRTADANLEITIGEYKKILDENKEHILVDVRDPTEYNICSLANDMKIPFESLLQCKDKLDPDKQIIIYCHHGIKSLDATRLLLNNGYHNVKSLSKGIDGWAKEIDQTLRTY